MNHANFIACSILSGLVAATAAAQQYGPNLLPTNPFSWTITDSSSNWRLGYFAARWDNGIVTSGTKRYDLVLTPGRRYRLSAFGASGRSTYGDSDATIGVGVEGGIARQVFAMNNLNTWMYREFIAQAPPHTAVISYNFVTLGRSMMGVARVERFELMTMHYPPQLDLPSGPLAWPTDCPLGAAATVSVLVSSLSRPDDPTQWSIDWGDGTIDPSPTIGSAATHAYTLSPGEAERAFTISLSGTNPAGSSSDSVQVIVRRRDAAPPTVTPPTATVCPDSPITLVLAGNNPVATGRRWEWRDSAEAAWMPVSDGLNTASSPASSSLRFNASGADTERITISLLEAVDASLPAGWAYRCMLSGPCGPIASDAASLVVNPSITRIVSQPESRAIVPGSVATFRFDVAGVSVQYRWRRNGTPLFDGPRVSGADSPTLSISQVGTGDQAMYDCVATGACGSVTSAPASLSCTPIITQQPQGGRFVGGYVVTLSATVVNTGSATYRWRKNGANLFNSATFAGVTTPTLSIHTRDPNDSGAYALISVNACGSVTSDVAIVDVRCLSDFNEDGGVDGSDVVEFFIAWEQGLATADSNQDGGIDGGDVSAFFDRWEAGC